MKLLVSEDFNDFPLGELPYDKDHSALGEYHHLMDTGYFGNFYDPINNHQWRSMGGSWMVTNAFNKNYLEQNRGYNVKGHFSDLFSILVQKEYEYENLTVETKIILLSTMHETGVAFNYIHNRKYYAITISGSNISLYIKDQITKSILAQETFVFKALREYKLKLVKENGFISVLVDDVIILNVKDPMFITKGKVALISQNACKFDYLYIFVSKEEENRIIKEQNQGKIEEENRLEKYPKLELLKKIDLKGKGTGRQIRIGFIDDNKPVFVFAQHQKRQYRDAFAHISALTCFDLEGNILWQIGETLNNLDNGPISCDLPFQISDINNDGKKELIYVKDFMIHIIDLKTGKLLKAHLTPFVKGLDTIEKDYPFDYLNCDGLRIADFRGLGYPADLMLKDRYSNVFGINGETFEILFKYHHKNTGHFPYVYDFDNDKKDELFIGYDMTKDGKVLWSLPYNSDHTDEIIYESLKEDEEKVILLASGNEGFNVVSKNGEILHSIPVGHAQRISLANYDQQKEGYEICVTSFWGANGIIYTFDANVKMIAEKEFIGNGNIITPVNYDNSDEALILMNTSPNYGGLFDSNLNVCVKFPNDGHPTLASEAFDLDEDGVDEFLTWDMDALYIYKASRIKNKKHDYLRYPENGFSNYRGEYLIKKIK